MALGIGYSPSSGNPITLKRIGNRLKKLIAQRFGVIKRADCFG
jgi:hypothetical protein